MSLVKQCQFVYWTATGTTLLPKYTRCKSSLTAIQHNVSGRYCEQIWNLQWQTYRSYFLSHNSVLRCVPFEQELLSLELNIINIRPVLMLYILHQFQQVYFTVLWHVNPLLGNGPISMYSWQQKKVFSMGSVPRSYLEGNRRYRSQLRNHLGSVNQWTTEFPLLSHYQKMSSEDMAEWQPLQRDVTK
jgi:hypothetical protein